MRLIPFLLAALLALSTAQAATLKPFGRLSGSVVRLSDIWDGVQVDKPLGPAPAPGGSITVPAPQLAAIARQFAVDWRPSSSGDRVILERPGRALTRDDVKPALWAALLGAGVSADADLELSAFTAAPAPVDAKLDVNVQNLELDQGSGRFSAIVEVQADDAPATQLRLVGRVQQMIDLPVARRRILPGDVLAASDLAWARIRTGLARAEIVRTPAEAIGLAAKRSIAPNQPIPTADLGRPIVVQKGETMTLTLAAPGLAVTGRGIATEPGGVGDRIRVLNEYAHAILDAEITGPGHARVVPGTARRANRLFVGR